MLAITKTELDPADLDTILASDLYDDNTGEFYSITLKTALDEILGNEYLEACQYSVGTEEGTKKLMEFTGWTKTKVIFSLRGMFFDDCLLSCVPRNCPTIERFTI